MTLEEFLEQTLGKINECKTKVEINLVLTQAEKVLKDSNISESDSEWKWFWSELHKLVESGKGRRFLREATAQQALNALVAQALAAIAAMSAKSK